MSQNGFSLLDLNGLAEPATKLIEAVSSAIGVLYEPRRIREKAKAEGDAAVILALKGEEVQEINVRATERLAIKELRRQRHIESIVDLLRKSCFKTKLEIVEAGDEVKA